MEQDRKLDLIKKGVIIQIPLKGKLRIDQVGGGTPAKGMKRIPDEHKVKDATLDGASILRSTGST
jgi:hypothetical protein